MSHIRNVPFGLLLASPVALVYGLAGSFYFRAQSDDPWYPMSVAFLFLLPFAIGAITVFLSPRRYKTSWAYGILMPWVPVTVLGLAAMALLWEAAICVVMALPIFYVMSSASGLLLTWFYRRRNGSTDGENALLGILLLGPYLISPMESWLPEPDSIRPVHSSIIINASPEVIWNTITAVPEIQPNEHRRAAFQMLGLPRPIEATLSGEGIGAIRHARYSNGLAIIEPVIEWQPNHRFAFEVALDPSVPPPPPFEMVGSRHFEVQRVGFTLEPQSDGRTLLRLDSTHRLTTHFNSYGGPWTDFLMRDFQSYILQILKSRAESHAASE